MKMLSLQRGLCILSHPMQLIGWVLAMIFPIRENLMWKKMTPECSLIRLTIRLERDGSALPPQPPPPPPPQLPSPPPSLPLLATPSSPPTPA
jgi:hypothetical protein